MSQTLSVDDDARAEMLCYLVIGELVAKARTDETANGAKCDWQDRVALAQNAAEFAPKVLASFQIATEQSLTPLFADGWMLDYRSSIVDRLRHPSSLRRSTEQQIRWLGLFKTLT
ncbi:hypothetical protein [Paraburkholderia aromaticivorans]|uniref:hypothetical protein n=1 Tax=Paraburkholderia aromaticivorans TaxID=2026199 RepID=UPI0038B7554F